MTQTPDKTLRDEFAVLIKIAAGLIRGDFRPSDYAEDYQRPIPKWMLKEFERHAESHRRLGMEIKSAVDNIRKERLK